MKSVGKWINKITKIIKEDDAKNNIDVCDR